MSVPQVKPINLFPQKGMIPTTYSEYVNKLKCTCPAGAIIKPSPLPSATKNLGDVISEQARLLSGFTSAYGMITVVIRMISCIIEVLCALVNPFSVIAAIIKLFGTCLPDFISIFPQLTIPAIIICLIKIILAIIEYILTVIVPLINDIIKNIQMLINAFASNNQDAQLAIAFKITSLFKELQNILGILATLGALWEMIKTLLNLGIGIPCRGSDACCNDENCPPIIKNSTTISGSDGILNVYYTYEIPLIYFSAPSLVNDLKSIRDFFPAGFNYVSVTDKDKLPYVLTVENTDFAMSGVDSGGSAILLLTESSYITDGYLSNVDMYGAPLPTTCARFCTSRDAFVSTYENTRYIVLQDRRGATEAANNNGTWLIKGIYDGYSSLLEKTGTLTWSYGTNFSDIKWCMAPQLGSNKKYLLDINHEELIRHNLIGIGCHPAVRATVAGVENRFPQLKDTVLPELPDLDKLISDLNGCLTAVAPLNITSDWVLDNYSSMATNIVGLQSCVADSLNNFKNDMVDYLKKLIDKVLDLENSILATEPPIQMIGHDATINVIPLDKNGAVLTLGLPPGTIDVEISASSGELSSTMEILDEYGISTGIFGATLNSFVPITSQIGATIDGYDVAYFDGYSLQPRYVYVQFVEPSDYQVRTEGSNEPLGVGRS
jgi:hypothetical protein